MFIGGVVSEGFSFIHDSFIAICRATYVENVASEALEAVAMWSVIGKVVSFYTVWPKVACHNFRGAVRKTSLSETAVATWQR